MREKKLKKITDHSEFWVKIRVYTAKFVKVCVCAWRACGIRYVRHCLVAVTPVFGKNRRR